VLWLAGAADRADAVWAATTAAAMLPALAWALSGLLQRRVGVDLIAVLALVGTLAVGEYLAGALVAVMLATGRLLEALAGARAERDLRLLASAAPRVAHRREGTRVVVVDVALVEVGDLLLVATGEVVAVDRRVETGPAVLDESTLTGESVPVRRHGGEAVRSGAVNAGGPFDLRVTRPAAESTYAGIVRLVEAARRSQAPFVRLADRYAAIFLPVALAVAGIGWAVSGQAVRAVAVLVVATPCPLILAAPVAIVSGLSRAARRGVIVKGGAVLERLADVEEVFLDKTGTLTAGRPRVADVVSADATSPDTLLRLAASLDQVSAHVLAEAVVAAARARGLRLALPEDVAELPGVGVRGTVEGRRVAVGSSAWVGSVGGPSWTRTVRRRCALDGSMAVFVGLDGVPAGALLVDDPLRPDAPRMLRRLRAAGVRRIVMLTGDRIEVAESVGAALGIDAVLAERDPREKVSAVRVDSREHVTLMAGDGVNDAPALAAASVGVALASRGASASSEAADVVLTVDRLDRLAEAMAIAARSRAIARQSVLLGMGLSLLAMAVAAGGALPPVAGALLQEVIDVAAIANALRALRPGRVAQPPLTAEQEALSSRFAGEHQRLSPHLDRIRAAAAALGAGDPGAALAQVREAYRFCVVELLPHENAEDALLYPALAPALGGREPTATMSRTHGEIRHLVRRLGRLLDEVDPEAVTGDDVRELQQALYGLHAVARLHFAQEEEDYFTLAE
jgi:heavy metal translocating P-type ATPase